MVMTFGFFMRGISVWKLKRLYAREEMRLDSTSLKKKTGNYRDRFMPVVEH
jgi:hypothetical protein